MSSPYRVTEVLTSVHKNVQPAVVRHDKQETELKSGELVMVPVVCRSPAIGLRSW